MAEGGGAPSRKRAFPFPEEEEDSSSTQHKIRFPKGKKPKKQNKIRAYVVDPSLEEEEEELVPPLPGWKDPRQAAKARALARTRLTGGLLDDDDRVEPDDITRVEIHYDHDGTFVDDGVPIDPFNLVQERQDGYFDDNGNYVEYITDDIKDAWLDTVEANRNIAAAPTNDDKPSKKKKKEEEDDVELSLGNVAEINRRIADVLKPGETVLQALRRLKGNSDNRKVKMSEGDKHVFDQLTEDAMHLLENGDYNVYNERQETFHREAEGYEKLAEARRQAFTSSTTEVAYDMYGDEDASGDATAINPAPSSDTTSNTGGNVEKASDSDYVFDETSGYYYSNSLGYYYDPSTRLYCYASTGQWYSYNEESGAYEECQQQQQQQQEEDVMEAAGVSS